MSATTHEALNRLTKWALAMSPATSYSGDHPIAVALDALASAQPAPGEATVEELIDFSEALERRRCITISGNVKSLAPRWENEGKPTAFSAGFEAACEEIAHRIEHEEWVFEDPAAPSLPPAGDGGMPE